MDRISTSNAGAAMVNPEDSGPTAFGFDAPSISPFLEGTLESIEAFGRENPWEFGLCMLGLGFILGWKLKPW